jgi:hypothetical protein
MALSSNNNISKIKLGRIAEHTIGLLRLIHKLMGVKFKITEKEVDDYDQEYADNEDDYYGGDMGEENEDYDEVVPVENKPILPK